MDTLSSIQKIGIGATGVVGSNITASVVDTVNVPIHDWVSALTQVCIALATIFSLFKKKSKQ
jgi:hypothetical protein